MSLINCRVGGELSAVLLAFALAPISGLCSGQSLPVEVPQLLVFVGDWRGQLELSEPGEPAQTFKFVFDCKAAVGAWAVTCTGSESNKELRITEADLLGYDPNEHLVHFFAVDNQAETHDHKGRWTDPQTLALEHTGSLEGKPFSDELTIVFHGTTEFKAEFIGTVEGKEIYRGKIRAKK